MDLFIQRPPLPHILLGGKPFISTFHFCFGYRTVEFPAHIEIMSDLGKRCHKKMPPLTERLDLLVSLGLAAS
jgi:hypothetical protein